MTGELTDTYVAAIQHDLVDLPPETRLVGVVRKPTPWFHGAVDENYPELGPPADLLDAFQDRKNTLKQRGICDEGAHNATWEELNVAPEYRAYLDTEEPQQAIEELRGRLSAGTTIALVCYENTDEKRCHRTILREIIDERSGLEKGKG